MNRTIDKKRDVLVIVPTRSRPAEYVSFADAFFAHSTRSDLLFALDEDDPELAHYAGIPGVQYELNPRLHLVGTLNLVANKHADQYTYLAFMGDDHRIRTPGWDQLLIEAIDGLSIGIAYGNDLLPGAKLPTAALMHANIVRTLGYVLPPVLIHYLRGNVWRDLGQGLGVLRYREDVLIEHLHPGVRMRDDDAVYQESNNAEAIERDQVAYDHYTRRSLARDIASLWGSDPKALARVPQRGLRSERSLSPPPKGTLHLLAEHPVPSPAAARFQHETISTVVKQLYPPYEAHLRRSLQIDSRGAAIRDNQSMRVVSDHSGWNLGNRLFGAMAALQIAACLDAPPVEGLAFPEFGFETPRGEPLDRPLRIGGIGIDFDLDDLWTVRQSGNYDGVLVHAYGMRLEYFIAQRAFWQPLVSKPLLDIPPVADDEVVINIRCGDKNRPKRPVFPIGGLGSGYDYSPLPIDFYRTVIDDLGLSPVFVGQINDDRQPYAEYIDALRQSFPGARFISGGAAEDFEMVRRAKNKVIAISTFSWLAAWLGPDDSRIVQPVAGFLNPTGWPEYDLIPHGDARYTFRWVHVIPFGPKMSLVEFLEELSRRSHGYPRVYG